MPKITAPLIFNVASGNKQAAKETFSVACAVEIPAVSLGKCALGFHAETQIFQSGFDCQKKVAGGDGGEVAVLFFYNS